jgi:hypothetical protein
MITNLQIENSVETLDKLLVDCALQRVSLSDNVTVKQFWNAHPEGTYVLLVPSLNQSPGGPANIHVAILSEGVLKHATLDYLHMRVLAAQQVLGLDAAN